MIYILTDMDVLYLSRSFKHFLDKLIKINGTLAHLNVIQAAITGHKGSDFLAIFYQLHSDTLANSRVRLFGFYTPVNQTQLQHIS